MLPDIQSKLAARKERKARRDAKANVLAKDKPKLKSRKWYVRNLDQEFSRQVRGDREYCFWCPEKVECCFHILSRKAYATRWDFNNATASCFGCNAKMEHDPLFINMVVDTWRQRLGVEEFDAMIQRHRTPTKFSRSDLAAMLSQLQSENVTRGNA